MPGPKFFRNLGLFVDDFLDSGLCAQVCAEMRCAASDQGEILFESGEVGINASVRRVMCAKVEGPTKGFVRERLEAFRPRLEEHFSIRLAASPRAEFLIYTEGAFYIPHTDVSRDPNLAFYRRRVSVVIFLNRESEEPAQDGYGGGKLTLYGILKEPQWAKCAFSLDSHPGLMIAFPSDLLHEVKPITFGQRFTIVSWFLADI